MGCGTKFTQAILGYDIPVGEFIGVDVYKEMIEFLRSSTNDPRLAFHHVNTHNDMYNPDGEKLRRRYPTAESEEHSCDVICLFSVFTHLAPADYTNMLKVMRRYARMGAKLIFTLYLDEVSNNGHGLIEKIVAQQDKPWQPSSPSFSRCLSP